MINGHNTTKFFVVATVAVLAIVFLFSRTTAFASSKAEIKKGEILDNNISQEEGGYLSKVFKTDFTFNVVGLAWEGDERTSLFIRLYDSKGWSKWAEVGDRIEKDGWHYLTEPMVADRGTKLQYKIESTLLVKSVKLVYLTNEQKFSFTRVGFLKKFFNKAQASEELNIVTRSEWEADESWRLTAESDEIWPSAYQWPEKFVLHHTAGSDGGDDPEAVLRGIYYWHAVVLGWGDIGYNYVIDQNGTIYEGRAGGEGVIGAHVYRGQECSQSRFGQQAGVDFNKGSIGIAVLGDYENNLTLNEKVEDALTTLIAHFSRDFEIEPKAEGFFVDANYPNIVGHKDLDCTACPGESLYQMLDVIREGSQQKYEALGGVVDAVTKATFIGQSENPITINAGEEKEVWVEFKNDGNTTWRAYGQNKPYVVSNSSSSLFQASDWESENRVTTLDDSNVASGSIGRFSFTIKAPADRLTVKEEFELAINEESLPRTKFNISAEITGLTYAASLESKSIKQAMFLNDHQEVRLQFKNRGLNNWKKGEVKLNIYDLGDKKSRLYDSSWPEDFGEIDFKESKVKPEELATFTFYLKAPSELGHFKNIYRLQGTNEIIQKEEFTITRIDSVYQAELVSHTIPLAVLNYWRIPAVVRFRNTGIGTWDQNLVLNVYDLGKKTSKFRDSSWKHQAGQFTLKENEVKSGQIGTFEFVLKAPLQKGIYLQILELGHSSNRVIIQNSEAQLLTRVD